MTLAIDPRDPTRTRLVLIEAGGPVATTDITDRNAFFSTLTDFVESHEGVKKLERWGVVVGGGSFSGVRQAVVVSKVMGFVTGKPPVAFAWKGVEPTPAECRQKGSALKRVTYAGLPNITKPKRKSAR